MPPKPTSTVTPDLTGHYIFLSASFPSGERAERFRPFDPGSISDAVVAVVKGVLAANALLVFGGHPTITPLVLLIASEIKAIRRVVVYQSQFFRSRVTSETLALEQGGYGIIHWVKADSKVGAEGQEPSLLRLRRLMLRKTKPAGAFFIGGMEGIIEEWQLAREQSPTLLRFAIGRPGGAAGQLANDQQQLGVLAEQMATSEQYPVVVHDALLLVSERLRRLEV